MTTDSKLPFGPFDSDEPKSAWFKKSSSSILFAPDGETIVGAVKTDDSSVTTVHMTRAAVVVLQRGLRALGWVSDISPSLTTLVLPIDTFVDATQLNYDIIQTFLDQQQLDTTVEECYDTILYNYLNSDPENKGFDDTRRAAVSYNDIVEQIKLGGGITPSSRLYQISRFGTSTAASVARFFPEEWLEEM